MNRGIIFDLDQTIIDSIKLEPLRKARRWSEVYSQIPQIKLYEGIHDLFAYLQQEKTSICIVTNSPRPYCEKVVEYFQLPVKSFVCYHDVTNRKPHAEPILKAIEAMKLISGLDIVSIGDKEDDLVASRNSGVSTIGALWGSAEIDRIVNFKPEYLAKEPVSVIEILKQHWKN